MVGLQDVDSIVCVMLDVRRHIIPLKVVSIVRAQLSGLFRCRYVAPGSKSETEMRRRSSPQRRSGRRTCSIRADRLPRHVAGRRDVFRLAA
jgi:hypothetical protein